MKLMNDILFCVINEKRLVPKQNFLLHRTNKYNLCAKFMIFLNKLIHTFNHILPSFILNHTLNKLSHLNSEQKLGGSID